MNLPSGRTRIRRASFVLLLVGILPWWETSFAKTALLVVGNTTLGVSDAALQTRLNHYYTVTVVDDAAPVDTSKNVIVISASVDPALVGTKYRTVTKGVVLLHPELFDDMGMTAAGAFGSVASTQIRIADDAHQMAGGFLAANLTTHSVSRMIGWGTPAASALRVAYTADGNPSQVTIFGYDVGRPMVGINARARRVGYFLTDARRLRPDGWRLFDHATDWADGVVPPVSGGLKTAITWGAPASVLRFAGGCDGFSPTWAADGDMYTAYADCNGVSGALSKRSMGLARIIGAPSGGIGSADIDTGAVGSPDIDLTGPGSGLDATGDGRRGKKPASLLAVNGRVYIWVRNMTTAGTESRLKYSDDYGQAHATWQWATWSYPEFGYPVFVQYGRDSDGGGPYAYVVAHDNPAAYEAADRFILMRVPTGSILDRNAYQFFSGTPSAPNWVSYANRALRTAIFTSKGRCLRNGMSYNAARGRYYWWQQIPPTKFVSDSRTSGGVGVYSAPEPWGPWITVSYSEKWTIGPGERASFPTKWMSAHGIGQVGVMYLAFSGDDFFSVRKATIKAGY